MIYRELLINPNRSRGALKLYLQDANISFGKTKKRPLIIICPGGGYMFRATKEGEAIAFNFLAKGYHVAVLDYQTYILDRTNPDNVDNHLNFEEIYRDLIETILYIRQYQHDYFIHPSQIFVMGFSAGGHLAAYLATHWHNNNFLESIILNIP